MENEDLIILTAEITSSYVANNRLGADEVADLVQQIHSALASLGGHQEHEDEKREPAVSVRSSVKQDHLVCLVCGKKQKTLKRHLQSAHDMTPDEYREEFDLRSNYPMTSPEYSARRGEMAKAIGLGRKPNQKRGRKSAKATSK